MGGKGIASRRTELINLAHWIERRYGLADRAKTHGPRSEAEVIYAEVLKRIATIGKPAPRDEAPEQ